ncbi:hypothetical protein FXO38_15144 [Capsicum annuum]|uniref:F-box domain-containing protein n=1 Tax=Capsicum annuum TaxID=4072 RepID=A0A1U8G1V7_CAPAN|nr:F-box protein At2g40925 [Capsicum annuum]KAF3654423.1 hypothetical protein FXO38_15144 [Capsicum annuum]PHT88913.1 hypothetical protein T459_11019 [Capsicum annuum]
MKRCNELSADIESKKKQKKSISITKKPNLFDKEFNPSEETEPELKDVDQAMGTEILMDILKWLPLRSFLRFKCVSKFWNALISEPYFKMKQLSRAKNDKNSQRFVTSEIYPKGISPMYCCHLSSGSDPLNEDVQELDYPTGFIPWGCGLLCCCDP